MSTSMITSIRKRPLGCCLALATVALGSACEANRYPNCGAFEYEGPTAKPRLDDRRVDPKDCGSLRAQGSRHELVVDDPAGLDCAIEELAAGRPMMLELTYERNDAEPEDDMLFTDEDGLALWWRQHRELTTEYEARVHQLDVDRITGCQDEADDAARFLCFFDALEASEIVETCKSGIHNVD